MYLTNGDVTSWTFWPFPWKPDYSNRVFPSWKSTRVPKRYITFGWLKNAMHLLERRKWSGFVSASSPLYFYRVSVNKWGMSHLGCAGVLRDNQNIQIESALLDSQHERASISSHFDRVNAMHLLKKKKKMLGIFSSCTPFSPLDRRDRLVNLEMGNWAPPPLRFEFELGSWV